MVWKYQSGDLYELDTLYGFRERFRSIEQSKYKELQYALSFEKYGLPNWRTEVLRRQVGWEDAVKNIEIVNKAIEETKERLGV